MSIKLAPLVQTVVRIKIRGVYETRIAELKTIRERHVARLIDGTGLSGIAGVELYRRLIRDIDELIKNHESMQEAVLNEISQL